MSAEGPSQLRASLAQKVQGAELAAESRTRYLDLQLILRRAKTKQTLIWVGGRWDRVEKEYTDEDPEAGKIIDLEESQVEFTQWFETWLQDFRDSRPRDISVAMVGGPRRGGKTFCAIACVLAAAIEVPNSICWLVAKSFAEIRELDDTVKALLPRTYYRYRGAPRYEFRLPNGSTITVESADDPERLKKGRADVVLVNEPQKMDVGAFVNSLGGTIDKGGLVLCAANPPRRVIGQWVLDFKELVEAGKIPGCKFFGVDSTLNERIDHGAKQRYRDIVVALDPKAAAADADGGWFAIGDVSYPNFASARHARPVAEFGEMTPEVTRRKTGREYKTFGGVDFQNTPHHVGVVVQVFRSPENKPIYWATGEVFAHGSEDDFLDTVDDYGLIPESHLWIGDASGAFQDGKHTKGRQSFRIFQARRWHIQGPQRKKTNQGDFSKNPDVADRLSLVNKLLAEDRLFVDPSRCPRLTIALKKCELKHGKPYGKYAHVTDALGYALWWAEPRPGAPVSGPGVWSVPDAKRSGDW